MRRRKAAKGQIFTLIILVLIGLLVVFGLISVLSSRRRTAPTVEEVSWLVDGQEVTTASFGDEVKARIVIRATEEYVGSIVIKVRKDVSIWFDSDFEISTIPIDLVGGGRRTIEIEFTPDEASNGGLGGLRGYFVEIEFRATGTTWEMGNSYPPRLRVLE